MKWGEKIRQQHMKIILKVFKPSTAYYSHYNTMRNNFTDSYYKAHSMNK